MASSVHRTEGQNERGKGASKGLKTTSKCRLVAFTDSPKDVQCADTNWQTHSLIYTYISWLVSFFIKQDKMAINLIKNAVSRERGSIYSNGIECAKCSNRID